MATGEIMFIKVLDLNLKITFHGEKKRTFAGGNVYEVDKQTGKKLIESNFAVEISPEEMEKEKHEHQDV